MHRNPYAKDLEGHDAHASLEEMPHRIAVMVRDWPRERDEASYAPGKWSAREILLHLAHVEVIFAARLRYALAQDHYVVQPFDQDDFMRIEPHVPALAALEAYLSLRELNLLLIRELGPADRARHFTHPDFGDITVDWLIAWCAGHERHHLPQLMAIAA